MLALTYTNCNEAFPVTMMMLRDQGVKYSSRNGDVLEYPEPVSIMYTRPQERVLFCSKRNINPFLHFFEPLWILQGRNDVAFLASIVSRFKEYSDDGETFAAAYGHRLRYPVDQIERAIRRFKKDPDDRRVVLQIRTPEDIAYNGKDAACNVSIALKIRKGKLNLHVFNRSNDAIWGGPAGGANYPQFTMLQEYIAGHVGVGIGTYHQTTDNMHVYVDNPQWPKLKNLSLVCDDPYADGTVRPYPMMLQPELFDIDLYEFFHDKRKGFRSVFFNDVVVPMYETFRAYKEGENAMEIAYEIGDSVWQHAVMRWVMRKNTA